MLKLLRNYSVLNDGSVFKGVKVVEESILLISEGRITLHNWKGLLKILLTYKKVQLDKQTNYVVVHNSYNGYFHWLLESLPRILIAKANFPHFTILLPASFTDVFYKESLALLGIELADQYRIQPGLVYQAPVLGLPYLLDPMGSFTPSIVANLKKELLSSPALKHVSRQLPTAERLYVSRKKATRRKIANEDELEQLLAAHGFVSICFEDFSLFEQIIICSKCTCFMSIHGAGLSNILFMPDNSTVIELRKYDANLNWTYERLAAALGYAYELVYCQAVDENQTVQDADLLANTSEIKAILEKTSIVANKEA